MIKINKYYFSERPGIIDLSEKAVSARQYEIGQFSKMLYDYGVLVKDLTVMEIQKRDRDRILNAAYFIVRDIKAFDILQQKKEIPYKLVCREIKVNTSFISEFREYIIAYTVILSNPEFKYLQEFLMIKEKTNESASEVVELIADNKKVDLSGIVIQCGKKSSVILTSQGQFMKINSQGDEVGSVATGEKKSTIGKYKLHIVVGILSLVIFVCGMLFMYSRVHTTLTVNTTSSIVYGMNNKNKIVEAKSQPSKGKELIERVNPLDKNVDIVIKDTIKYANDNNMIPKGGIIINVSGENLEYGLLEDSRKYIKENNINVLINNNGNEQKL